MVILAGKGIKGDQVIGSTVDDQIHRAKGQGPHSRHVAFRCHGTSGERKMGQRSAGPGLETLTVKPAGPASAVDWRQVVPSRVVETIHSLHPLADLTLERLAPQLARRLELVACRAEQLQIVEIVSAASAK
jgi:hypothetical protein